MAKVSTSLPAIDPEKTYRVALTRSVPVGRAIVHPGPRVHLRGDIILSLAESHPGAVEQCEAL